MKLIKKLFIPLCLTVATMVGITACSALEPIESSQDSVSISIPDPITYTLNLTADKTTAKRGDVVTLAAYLHSEEAEDELAENAVFSIVEGASAATLSGNKLTISNSAAANTVIKVKAKIGITDSNVVEIKVDVPLEGVSISAGDVTNLLKGTSVTLTKTIYPEGADTSALEWTVTEGSDYASFNGDVLVVSDKAPTGAIIKVKAVSGDISSKELSFTVGYPLTGLTLAQPNKTNLLSGESIDLTVTKTPENATDVSYAWEFVQGEGLAAFIGDTLIVNTGVATGEIIEVKAVCGEFETETVSFTVGYPLEELKLTADVSTNVPNGETITFSVTKVPENTTNGDFEWVITAEDESYYTFDEATGKLYITYDAPLNTEINVQAVGAKESAVITVIVGVPLEGLEISSTAPSILTHGESYDVTLKGTPEEANTKGVQWVTKVDGVEGKWASFADGKFTVSNSIPHGATLTIQAVSGSITSDELSYQVGIGASSLEVTVLGKTNVDPGANTQLTVSVLPENATDKSYTWKVVGNGRVVNDYLIVNSDANIGDEITVTAVAANGVESDPVVITVGVPVTGVKISLIGSANIDPGDYRTIKVTLEPTNASQMPITWVYDETLCSIEDSVIVINSGVAIGTQISVKAIVNGYESNTLAITVGTLITEINVNPEIASGSEVERGTRFDLNATVKPTTATAAYSWVFTQGGDWAEVIGNKLVIDPNTPDGTVVELYAASGDVTSATLTYTVTLTEKEVNATKYYMSLSGENFTVDKNATSATSLKVELYNFNYEKVTDKEFTFTVIEGNNFVEVTANGAVCTFKAIGHGQAFVEISVAGITEQVVVNAIVPPTSLILPEMFITDDRTNFAYNFSMYDHNSNGEHIGYDLLPFVTTVGLSDNNMYPCTDLVYTFKHADGTTGDAVATYADGKITFKKTGLVTVTVSSNSGSRVETTVSYTFNINDGYNVYSFQEASNLIHPHSGFYKGQVVNFVALEKLVGEDGKDYGYAFVPTAALKKQEDQTFDEVRNSYNNRIIAINSSLYVNGNKHTLDASNLRVATYTEIQDHLAAGGEWINHGGFLSAEPYTSDGTDVVGDFFVKIYDLTVKGNADINYTNKGNPDASVFEGAYNAGINVGNLGRNNNPDANYSAKYYVDVKNVEASAFKQGFKLVRVVEGTVENAYAHNCYQNGFSIRSSIVKMKDLKLGPCGAVGIELTPEGSAEAGLYENQPQTVTFEGTLDVTGNTHTMDTSYLNTYTVVTPLGSFTVPQILTGSIAPFTEEQVAHMRNEKGEFCLITFIMTGTVANSSQALYPSYQEGGIIDAADLPTDGTIDTTHQFIRLPVIISHSQYGTFSLGSALVYNLNYGK